MNLKNIPSEISSFVLPKNGEDVSTINMVLNRVDFILNMEEN